jgi:hypothetical protein
LFIGMLQRGDERLAQVGDRGLEFLLEEELLAAGDVYQFLGISGQRWGIIRTEDDRREQRKHGSGARDAPPITVAEEIPGRVSHCPRAAGRHLDGCTGVPPFVAVHVRRCILLRR